MSGEPAALSAIASALIDWLPSQRWFGGKGRRICEVSFLDHASLASNGAGLLLALIQVDYEDHQPDVYFLPLRPGSVESPGQLAGFEDALADGAACLALLRAVEASTRLPTIAGRSIAFERGPDFQALCGQLSDLPARPLGGEQSNTSIVFGEAIIMKCFRRIAHGPNPDLEVARFLATRTSFRHLPPLAGTIEYRQPSGSSSLALLQAFVRSQGDGWSYTLRVLADDAPSPASPYLAEVRALGRVTAELHLALASDTTQPDFAPEPVAPADLDAWRGAVCTRVLAARAALRRAESGLTPAARALAAPFLAADERRLGERTGGLFHVEPGSLMKIRHHGDLHLGQVLKTPDGWLVLDFEGEPLRTLAERRAKHCPLKDVAGMLRSFNYARHAVLRASGLHPGADLAAWERAVRAAFLEAYFERAGSAAVFLPRERRVGDALVRAFELEKAAYELQYELDNRPDWVEIPLAALADFVE